MFLRNFTRNRKIVEIKLYCRDCNRDETFVDSKVCTHEIWFEFEFKFTLENQCLSKFHSKSNDCQFSTQCLMLIEITFQIESLLKSNATVAEHCIYLRSNVCRFISYFSKFKRFEGKFEGKSTFHSKLNDIDFLSKFHSMSNVKSL